ncbi:MAG: hypothetical protein EA356_08560 [Geminicoccaceae bacterium]|nr:MAG: hypothetical protein EA356_08560 [Geminicoccaceae bacterium]
MPPSQRPSTPLDVVRHFIADADARGEDQVVAYIAIGKFAHDLDRWAQEFAQRKGQEPTDTELAECVQGTPIHRYDEMLAFAQTTFAQAAYEFLEPTIDEQRQQGDEQRLARTAQAAEAFLRYHDSDRFDRLFRDLERIVAADTAAKEPLNRLWDFGGHVLRGVLVTLVITLLLYVTLILLGAEIGPRELIQRIFSPEGG